MAGIITDTLMENYEAALVEEEKSDNTIDKYMRDIRKLRSFVGENKEITKEMVIQYKLYLKEAYKTTSANSMLAAINAFFRWAGWTECVVKSFKVQAQCFRSENKELNIEEYQRLAEAAQQKGQIWLYLIIITLCSTGIRISELPYITVQSLASRQARVFNKGKMRKVILPLDLCRKLKRYAEQRGIKHGSIFVTRSGKNIDRSNIYHAMKKLCNHANIEKKKVFPHNLRHLFAVQHYEQNHDLSGLAAILGHSNINTTRIYTMVTVERKEEEINALGLVV